MTSLLRPKQSFLATIFECATFFVFGLWLSGGFLLQGMRIQEYSAASCLRLYSDGATGSRSVVELLLLYALIFSTYLKCTLQNSWKFAILCCMSVSLIGCIIAFAQSNTSLQARNSVANVFVATTFGLLASRICGSSYRALTALCMLTTIEAIYTIVHLATGSDSFYSGHVLRASGSYEGPSALYKVLIVCTLIALSLSLVQRTRLYSLFWYTITVLVGSALLLTWYRTAIVALCASTLLLLLKHRVGKRGKIIIYVFVCSTAIVTICMRVDDRAGALSSRRSAVSRPILWQKGLHEFAMHPLLGSGQGRLQLSTVVGQGIASELMPFPSPQNQLVFALAEGGIVGGILLLWFSTALYCVLRQSQSPLSYGILASWLALALCGSTDTVYGIGATAYGPINCTVGMLIGATMLLPEAAPTNHAHISE